MASRKVGVGGGVDETCSEMDGWWERKDHPLVNDVILEKVFEELGRKDLKECRLVCKTWAVSSIPFTRKVYDVAIHANDSNKIHTLENFVDVFQSNAFGIPFGKFQLGSFCTTDGVGQEFLQLCGETTQSIHFDVGEFMVEDISELLRATSKLEMFHVPLVIRSRSAGGSKLFPENLKPKLTSLKKLTVWHDDPEERNKFCPTFVEELITAAENISSLSLYDTLDRRNVDGRVKDPSSLKVLSVIEQLGRESSIQELEIWNQIHDDSKHSEILVKLTEKPRALKLKKFSYVINAYGHETHKWLFNFLTQCNDTLESLTMREVENCNFMTLPKFPHLKKFYIHLGDTFSSTRIANLKEIFPVLEELKIGQFFVRQIDDFFPASDPCPSMKSLLPLHLYFSIHAFNQMLMVFPNLTNLRIDIELDGPAILRQIWSHMPQLESLQLGTMRANVSLDSILTGIPTHAHQELRHTIDNLNKIPLAMERRELILNLRSQHSQFPCIGNLTNLRSLSVEQGAHAGTGKLLTDLSGYLGFYSMTSLKHLSVHCCELTKTCCEVMRRDMGLETWSFRTRGDVNIIPSILPDQLPSSAFSFP